MDSSYYWSGGEGGVIGDRVSEGFLFHLPKTGSVIFSDCLHVRNERESQKSLDRLRRVITHLRRRVLRGLVLRQTLVFKHVHQRGFARVVQTLGDEGRGWVVSYAQ